LKGTPSKGQGEGRTNGFCARKEVNRGENNNKKRKVLGLEGSGVGKPRPDSKLPATLWRALKKSAFQKTRKEKMTQLKEKTPIKEKKVIKKKKGKYPPSQTCKRRRAKNSGGAEKTKEI